MNILSIDQEQSKRHLTLLGYQQGDPVFFRWIQFQDMTDPGSSSGKNFQDKYPNGIPKDQAVNQSLFAVVNGGGHSDAAVKLGRAVFYEHDDLPKSEQETLWKFLELPEPTFQIDTGGKSIHSYWVFEDPIQINDWKLLQADLLTFAKADPTIKNPSRIMRLAGSHYNKPGSVPGLCRIIHDAGHRYTFEQLRAIVPSQKTKPLLTGYGNQDPIPLERLISVEHRKWVDEGVGEGSRNSSGATLVRDLLGCESWAANEGIPCEGTSRQLLWGFGSHCTPPLDDRELESIYRSGQKSNPSPCLSPDKLANCVKAWQQKNCQKVVPKEIAAPIQTDPVETQQTVPTCGSDPEESSPKQPPIFKLLMAIAEEASYWHTPEGNSWADLVIDGIRQNYPIRRKQFKTWLCAELYHRHQRGANSEALQSAINVLDARAQFEGINRDVFLRVAEHEGRVYIDLANAEWEVIEVSPSGWRILPMKTP